MDYKNLSRNLLSKEAFWQVNKAIAKYTDNDTAILLADLISKEEYFENKGQMNGAYFFNTVENIKEDTNISKDRQRLCLKKLTGLGIIETKMLLIPRKRHYKINHEKLFLVLSEANKIYSERKTRRLESVNYDNCITQNTTTNNKNKDNKNKLNKNKININESFNNDLHVRYNSKDEFIKEISKYTKNTEYIKSLDIIYDYFLLNIGINHYKLDNEQMEKMFEGIKFIFEVIDKWNQLNTLLDYYFSLDNKYYSIQQFTNLNTLAFLLSKTGIHEEDRFGIDGFEGVI